MTVDSWALKYKFHDNEKLYFIYFVPNAFRILDRHFVREEFRKIVPDI